MLQYPKYSFSRSDLNVFFHISNTNDEYAELLYLVLKSVLSVFDKNNTLIEERWNVTIDSRDVQYSALITNTSSQNQYKELHDAILESCFFSVCSTYLVNMKQRKKIKIFATIKKSNLYTMPMIHNERIIEISIPKEFINDNTYPRLRKVIQTSCCKLGASFACLDIDILCPRSIFLDGFYCFSYHNIPVLAAESHLPGIHWAQFISPSMIEKTAPIESICDNVPSYYSELVEYNGSIKGAWIELSKNYWNSTIEKRLEYREFFSSSLYTLSHEKIEKYTSFYKQIVLDYLPLKPSEREMLLG